MSSDPIDSRVTAANWSRPDRRSVLAYLAAVGAAVPSLPGLLLAQEEAPSVRPEELAAAERLAGLEFTDEERQLMLEGVAELRESYRQLRQVPLANEVPPALHFDPLTRSATEGTTPAAPEPVLSANRSAPQEPEDLAFAPVSQLASLLRSRDISSLELTRLYLDRLKALGPRLECVITLTEQLALKQAARADREIGAGDYRGPLHGIPWGAKDLLSVAGYPTTWGAVPFKEQTLEENATVVDRLEAAGAVLLAKLTLGALAWGDVWFGGRTRNPWDLEEGSSGSSAGSASATAAGLVGFSLGSETWGSIVSPSTRCGTTGLRPTFGRVSRHGAMALSWSMDKLGPICRSVEDCGLVFAAIHGPDGKDLTVHDRPFSRLAEIDPKQVRLGYTAALFEEEPEDEEGAEWREYDIRTLRELERLGFNLIPVELPDLPVSALSFILTAEAAAAFDELTRSDRDDLLVRQIENAWPNVFRQGRTIPAVEYIQANRVRTLAMRKMAELFDRVDLYVAPSFGGDNLLLTNLTGHPSVVLPNGFRAAGTPTSITFIGDLFQEGMLLAVAQRYQDATDFHLQRPPLDSPAAG
jgi:Asp-tRNA(Asn)/Glu-tRNA(Gln) amidotransferase A subunit family amidase